MSLHTSIHATDDCYTCKVNGGIKMADLLSLYKSTQTYLAWFQTTLPESGKAIHGKIKSLNTTNVDLELKALILVLKVKSLFIFSIT